MAAGDNRWRRRILGRAPTVQLCQGEVLANPGSHRDGRRKRRSLRVSAATDYRDDGE